MAEHTSRDHALLSASGSSRWINCTPSAKLEEKYSESNPSPSSDYAAEGTLAHELAEITIRHRLNEINKKTFNQEFKAITKSKHYTSEMVEQVDKYVTYVLEAYYEVKPVGGVILVEEVLDFSHVVEKGFGTGDNLIIADGILDVIDLKYGKGIKVDAQNNSQLKLYGLGALHTFGMMYDISYVRLTIVQPRLDHISTEIISVKSLQQWTADTLVPAAKKAFKGEGVKVAGDWCKWCRVKAMCRTLSDHNVKLARHDFKNADLLEDKELAEIFKQIPMLLDWAKAVSKFMLDQAVKGKSWPGFKLVEGRSQRKWLNPAEVESILTDGEYERSLFMNEKLGGLAQIQGVVGKDDFIKLLGHQINKPQGAPTLVDKSDSRPAMGVEQAKLDFK